MKKKVKCRCPACNAVQKVEYSPLLSGTMRCQKCGVEFLAVPAKTQGQAEELRTVEQPFAMCGECGRHLSKKADKCPSCGAPTPSTQMKEQIRREVIRCRRRRAKLCAAVLLIAATLATVGLGFVHVISGSNLAHSRIVRKGSFGYSETFINIDKITGMPWVFAKSRYPIGCKVLQEKGHIESEELFERRIKRQFAQLHR